MKKEKIFFHPIEGSGPLTISWSSAPKGDAIEATQGSGVGFFSEKSDLLCVIFDDVKSASDHQVLEFDRESIDLKVKNGQITYIITQSKRASRIRKKRSKKANVS